jgi:hypothetical protein
MRLTTLLCFMFTITVAQADTPIFIEQASIVSFSDGRVYVCKRGTSKTRRSKDEISLDCHVLNGPWLRCEGKQKDRSLYCRPHKD